MPDVLRGAVAIAVLFGVGLYLLRSRVRRHDRMSRRKPGRVAVLRAVGFGVMSLVCFAVGMLLLTTGGRGRPSVNDYFLAASAALFMLAVAQGIVAFRESRVSRS